MEATSVGDGFVPTSPYRGAFVCSSIDCLEVCVDLRRLVITTMIMMIITIITKTTTAAIPAIRGILLVCDCKLAGPDDKLVVCEAPPLFDPVVWEPPFDGVVVWKPPFDGVVVWEPPFDGVVFCDDVGVGATQPEQQDPQDERFTDNPLFPSQILQIKNG